MLKDLRHRLRSLADIIASEADLNPEFAKAINELFEIAPPKEKQKQPAKRQAADPFEALRVKGKEGFETWLNDLNIPELRAIVREQRFDPSRLSDKWKTKERFIRLIIDRIESRSKQGDVFRSYGDESGSSKTTELAP